MNGGWTKVSNMTATLDSFGAMNLPAFLTYIVSYGELIGGVLLILGLWTAMVSLFLAIIMVAAIYLTRSMGFQVFVTPLAVLSGLLAILGCGGGKYRVKLPGKASGSN